MKHFRRLISTLAILCLLLAMLPSAFATTVETAAPEETPVSYEGKSWEQVIDEFLARHGISEEQISLAYYNTVTGEEKYLRPDDYMVAASLYKVPLNMIFAEKVSKGEMGWDTILYSVPYQQLMEETLINSSNNYSEVLWLNLGGYQNFRRLAAPYMGVDADTVDWKYYENNFFTAKQMMHCLKTLYNEPERFPKLLDTMKLAEPNNYFSLYEDRYEIAHKYGFNQEQYHLYLNDCGVVYTEDPIILVMFTDNVADAYEALADYCTTMCDYTSYNTEKRLGAEKLAEELRRQDEEAEYAAPEATPMPIPQLSEEAKLGSSALLSALMVCAAALAIIVVIILSLKKCRMRLLWAVISVLLAAAAVLLCILGSSVGTLIAKPEGDPKYTAAAFFEAIDSGDYNAAYRHMKGYSSLGLENAPADEVSAAAYEALQESYAFELFGEPIVDKLKAYQQVQISYLDLAAIQSDVEALTNANLNEIVQTRSKAQVYDENDKYLPEVTQEAYSKAVYTVLDAPKKYYVTTGVMLEMEYSNGRWLIIPGDSLLRALVGCSAY